MTHLLNQLRLGPVPMTDVEVAVQNGVIAGSGQGNRTVIKNQRVHVLRCNRCNHEMYNQPIPDHETYVPDGWGSYPDGTHRCPDCRTKRSLERESKFRADLIEQGVTVEEMRVAMQKFYGQDAESSA